MWVLQVASVPRLVVMKVELTVMLTSDKLLCTLCYINHECNCHTYTLSDMSIKTKTKIQENQ